MVESRTMHDPPPLATASGAEAPVLLNQSPMTFSDWIKQPFLWAGQACSALFRRGKESGGSLLAFLERPLMLALLIAVVGGFAGGRAARVELPTWRWPWHWPTPNPPAPTDPLAKSLQVAYDADTDADKASSLHFLRAVYAGMATAAPGWTDTKTNRQALAKMKALVEAPSSGLTAKQLVHTRQAIAAAFLAAFGGEANQAIDLNLLGKECAAMANALKEVK